VYAHTVLAERALLVLCVSPYLSLRRVEAVVDAVVFARCCRGRC